MKTKFLCLFLLIIFPVRAFVQTLSDEFKVPQKKIIIPESVKVISIYAGSIILNAVGDGLKDSGEKEWGHACNALSTGLLLVSPFVINYDKSKWGYYLSSYVFLRIALFDYSYNLTRKLPLNYIGRTSVWDNSLGKIASPGVITCVRATSFVIGVTIPIMKFDSRKRDYKLIKPTRR